jgi:hypothetical protein
MYTSYVFRFVKVLFGICVAYGMIVTSLLLVEDRILLHPSHDEQQSKQSYVNRLLQHCDHLECLATPSGAMCFQLTVEKKEEKEKEEKTIFEEKTILLCHGNAGNVLEFIPLLSSLFRFFNRVYLVEYRGFGCASSSDNNKTISTKDVLDDVHQIVLTLDNQNKPIHTLLGYSIGGGVVAQLLNKKPFITSLQSVLILNSFASIQQMVTEHIPVPAFPIYSLMQCQWNTTEALSRALENTKDLKIFWVYTKDDRLISPTHTETIKKHIPSCSRFTILELPNGGHNGSIFAHLDLWVSSVFVNSPE